MLHKAHSMAKLGPLILPGIYMYLMCVYEDLMAFLGSEGKDDSHVRLVSCYLVCKLTSMPATKCDHFCLLWLHCRSQVNGETACRLKVVQTGVYMAC